MRIVVINATTDLYGANRILSLALQAFPTECKIQLWVPELKGPLINFIKTNNANVNLIECPSLPVIQRKMFSIGGGLQAVNLVKQFSSFLKSENSKEPIDLLYINTLSNFLVVPIARRFNINTLVHVHEILESPKIISHLINKYTLEWGTSVLAVSEAVKSNLVKSNPKYAGKIKVIHNGIPDLNNNTLPLSDSTQKCIITLIARIKPEKGIWYFLESLNQIQNHHHIHVRIIGGSAPYGEKYIDQLKKDIELSKISIEYISFTPDVSKYLNETDILVVPSIMKDPFPTTVLEGMSCGKAIISTDTGGAAEAIIHKESGILISSNNSLNFAQVLDYLITEPQERNRLGENARKRFLDSFSLDIYKDKMYRHLSQQLSH